ncbi:phosphotransacetylase [Rhodospirillum rubrum ATCC 11170]|uniref:Phosphate acetyltransferase n=4 Tax=Rhodospirillum rubrum TaxID=1085 RepID=Q2RQ03_RHORT|nr:phosphate acetyltransferase [Rhodospirillum rubrum]AAN75024.1 Pta [Rhodospirillum rubrum ATCC 11170]ABC23792.1 phosphotransacetylase [Rhodospirillum rubrum ATCC 11170]
MPARMFFLAPMAQDVGLTSVALGLARALQRDGIKVGFAKPIGHAEADGEPGDPSSHFARSLCLLEAPESIAFARAEDQVRRGDLAALMEEVVTLVDGLRASHDAVIIEGLIPGADTQVAGRLNAEMARALGADLIPVLSGAGRDGADLAEAIALARRQYDGAQNAAFAGVLINKVSPSHGAELRGDLERAVGERLPILATIPFETRLQSPRLADVVRGLGLTVEHEGALAQTRVREIVIAARSVENIIERLRPGALVVTPVDRIDIVLAATLASLRGVPLAGVLLTCGGSLPDTVASLVLSARPEGLPILSTPADTYATASRLSRLSGHVGADDHAQMEEVIDFIAEQIATAPLRRRIGEPGEVRMSPPAFRNRLIQSARRAAKRIVLPEGDEPRTLQAAIACHAKGIARCVLLGHPAQVRQVASAQGLEIPADLEILDPELVRGRYVEALVEMRRAKGLTALQAAAQLEDTVVLGTVMLALGEVDGLVSGAVHTTASTVRPALQLIKTAPGASIVSSVFFMLMPDQVLVYGDCAINPNPTAEQLADIAIQSADSALAFGIEPRVAMISYSTGSSGVGDDVEKVRAATALAKLKRPDLMIDGPMQYDAASVESVGRQKAPDSPVAGRANVFVFPDLNTGNTTYKAVQRSANVVSVGPMLQGLRKPVNDLSRGALVDDIVYTIALTAIQADQGADPMAEKVAAE